MVEVWESPQPSNRHSSTGELSHSVKSWVRQEGKMKFLATQKAGSGLVTQSEIDYGLKH